MTATTPTRSETIPEGAKPVVSPEEAQSSIPVLKMRDLRRMVRQTASLVSTDGPIYEEPGPNWAADYERRVIFWRATSSAPPHWALTHDQLLFLTVHEAYHIKVTGGYKCPDDFHQQRFHRLVNAGEDIRIERIGEKEFPGFASIRRSSNHTFLSTHDADIAGYCFLDQVWLNWMRIEHGMPTIGHPACVMFAENSWPKITRIFNAASTEKMAKMLEPYYRALIGAKAGPKDRDEDGNDTWPKMEPPKSDEVPDDPGADAKDEPTDQLERSERPGKGRGKEGRGKGEQHGLDDFSEEDDLRGMAEDAENMRASSRLRDKAQSGEKAKAKASGDAKQINGHGQGPGSARAKESPIDSAEGAAKWDAWKSDMRPQINALARQLTTKLKHNAMDDWTPGLRRGQLDTAVAYRSLGGNPHIFRDRHDVGDVDYTFGLTVDVSSSQRPRTKEVAEAAVLVAESCERAGINVFVVPWNVELLPFKRISQPLRDYAPQLARSLGRPRGGTYEAPALVWAQDEFKKARGTKVLITITDGETRRPHDSQVVIQELHDAGVRCTAISIKHAVPKHYPHSTRINDAHELVKLLPNIINEVVRKR